MSGYFYTLLVASLCGSVCMMLAWGGFEKYIKYIASLVCVVLLIAPLREIDISLLSVDTPKIESGESEQNEIGLNALSEQMTEERAEKYINELVFSKFGINPVSTDIKIDWGKREGVIDSIDLILTKTDMAAAEEIEKYLFSVLGGEVRLFAEE